MANFEPKILAFLCNWCSYGAADTAGVARFQYPTNIRVIRVMCSGRVAKKFIYRALTKGADGVLVAGCWPGDCHYISGNLTAEKRIKIAKKALERAGVNPVRLRLEWASAAEGERFANIVKEFVKEIRRIGPISKDEREASLRLFNQEVRKKRSSLG